MSRIPQYDYIVVGCGGVGSAAVYQLAKRSGKGVLGLEQFNLGHDHGGSQDWSRIIRLIHYPSYYIPLARGAYAAWSEIEKESGIQVLHNTGSLDICKRGTLGQQAFERTVAAMEEEHVPYERYEGERIRQRFPQLNPTSEWIAIYQKDTGVIDAALGNAIHIQLARKYGATIIERAAVTKIRKQDDLMKVYSTQDDFLCRKVIVTAGAWMNDVLSSVGVKIPLTVTQEQVTYFATPDMREFTVGRCPSFFLHTGDNGSPYFMPIYGNTGFKICLDVGGPVVQANTRNYMPDPRREEIARKYVAEMCPRALGPILYTKTCLYTLTPDRHFVIDNCRKIGHPDVIFCCGAGHAYKFAALFGKILTDLAVDGKTTFDISPFNMSRPAISDPNFHPSFPFGILDEQNGSASKL